MAYPSSEKTDYSNTIYMCMYCMCIYIYVCKCAYYSICVYIYISHYIPLYKSLPWHITIGKYVKHPHHHYAEPCRWVTQLGRTERCLASEKREMRGSTRCLHPCPRGCCMYDLSICVCICIHFIIYIFIQTYNYRLCNYTDMCLDTQRKARVCAEMQ